MTSDRAILYRHLKLVNSLKQAMDAARQNESSDRLSKYAGCSAFARKYMQLLTLISKDIELLGIIDSYKTIPPPAKLTTTNRQALFDGVYANLGILQSLLENETDLDGETNFAIRDFLQARLRSAIFRCPESERVVQDSIEQLLIGRGMQKGQDYDRESGRVKFSGKESVPDFNINNSSLALEVKFVRDSQRVSRVVDEINADIASYSKRYRNLLFVVYDLGYIRDVIEFRHDLESTPNVFVIVIKH